MIGAAMLLGAGCGSSSSSNSTGSTGRPAATGAQRTTSPTVFKPKLEATLKRILNHSNTPPPIAGSPAPPTPPGTVVRTVRCPAAKPAAGHSIKCSAQGAGGLTGTVTVTFDNAQGTPFHYKGKLQSSTVTQTASGSATIG